VTVEAGEIASHGPNGYFANGPSSKEIVARERRAENFSARPRAWQAGSTMRPLALAPTLRQVRARALRRPANTDWFESARELDTSFVRDFVSNLRAGADHLRRVVPGQLRLWKWRAGRALGRTSLAWLPVGSLVLFTAACGLVSQDGGLGGPLGKSASLPPLPGLSKTRLPEPRKRADAPWSYVLPVDHGVRVDESGKGHFRAPRFHGEHNGIDLLAPVGTPVFSACDGQVMSGVSRSFGHWLHVICPVPTSYRKSGGPTSWASFFYAHLAEADIEPLLWQDVTRGQRLGSVGKTGNADGANVQPHLHLELIVQQNQRAAMDEHHLGSDQSSVGAAEFFAATLEKECLDPFGFRPKSQLLRRARRLDPFVALSCLSDHKPDFRRAPAPLDLASEAWDRYYVAEAFNVNRGPEDYTSRR